MNVDDLVPISLVDHGHSSVNEKINPNQWKQRTTSRDLKEDFQDIINLRNSFKEKDDINKFIERDLRAASFKDTKRLLNAIDNNKPNLYQSHSNNIFLNVNKNVQTEIENNPEPIELMQNTHKVTEKIKFLSLFDSEEPAGMEFVEDSDEDVEMAELDDIINDMLDHETHSNVSSSDVDLLDTDGNKNNISMKTVLKSIVNPTELGIQLAQSVMDKEDQETHKDKVEDSTSNSQEAPCFEDKQEHEHENTNVKTETVYNEDGKHITINNHYYNYFNMQQPIHEYVEQEKQKLPSPWSSKSAPVQRQVYNTITYFQLALNGSMYFLAIMLVCIFIKTVSHDLANLFYQQKQDHLQQIGKCKEMYEINKCYLGIPKMNEVCLSWQRCMLDDADKKIVNKTRIYINLLTGVLSEFLSTIGFLNSISLCMLMYSGYFGLNLLFGYIRGKSYGKDTSQTKAVEAPQISDKSLEELPSTEKKQPLILTY
jgi:maltodextrin utilization protein YvdJ